MRIPLTITCLIFAMGIAIGQPLDSIGFSKVRMQAGKYELNRFGISKIKIKTKAPSVVNDNISTGEKIIEGIFTLFTGWSTSSSSESSFRIDNQVKFVGTNKKMNFPVCVKGFYEKSRDRVNNEDGSHSMETMETYNLFWDQGAEGLIIENERTLGDFVFKPGIMVYDSIGYWKSYLGRPPLWIVEKLDGYGYADMSMDFIVNIFLEDQYFTLVYSGEYFQCALISNQEMIGFWQDAPTNILLRSNRINPYLLLQSSLTEDEAQQTISLLTLGLSLARNQ